MLKLPPKLTYCGLTVVMSNPSRFDKAELLSGTGGWFFRKECLQPHHNIHQCEVRLKEDRSPYLPGTKVVLVLGLDAYVALTSNTNNRLGEIRGTIFQHNGIAHIPSYLPQDCMDFKDYESTHNDLLQGKDYDEEAPAGVKGNEKRRHGLTSRSNYRFWLKKDTEKAIKILHNLGQIPNPTCRPDYQIYPSSKEIIEVLYSHKNNNLYLDIETDDDFNIKCVGCSFDGAPVFVFPLLNHNYKRAYAGLESILQALVVSIRDNILVSHNGHQFDWIVLPWKYGIPVGPRFYDTMLAQHRCYPDVEKSLGHITSLWTYEPFHKDEGGGGYFTPDDMNRLMAYCGKDVYTMKLAKHAIDEHATKVPGLTASIKQVNDSIRAYVTMTLMGVHYKQQYIDEIMRENDRMMMQHLRMIDLLVGKDVTTALRRKSKKGMPGSNVQCCSYFHGLLEYPIVMRSKKTGNPSLAKKAMYSLRLRHDNPVIDLCLAYRECAKESGSLKFVPWMTKEGVEL